MFQDRIRANYDDLTPGFRKLADYIMNSTLDVAFLTATELSRRVGVDPATVVRFAQELEYSGFRELSREIKKYVRDQVTATYRKAQEAESTEALLLSLIENGNQNLNYFMTTDMVSVVQAVEMLREAKSIWTTGEYSGFDVAGFYAKMFSKCGHIARTFQPSMAETAAAVTQMQAGDVLITIAGNSPCIDAGYAVQLANEKGLGTITITGSGVALPARHSQVTVIVPSKSPAEVPEFGTLMRILSIIWEAVLSGSEESQLKVRKAQRTMTTLLELRSKTKEYDVASPHDIWGNQYTK